MIATSEKYFTVFLTEYLKERILEPYVPEEKDVRWLLWYIIEFYRRLDIPIDNQSNQLLALFCA